MTYPTSVPPADDGDDTTSGRLRDALTGLFFTYHMRESQPAEVRDAVTRLTNGTWELIPGASL